MMPRVMKRICVVMGLALATACGGVAPEEGAPGESPITPAAEAPADDTSAMGPIGGCGYFQYRCCEGSVCYNGLECDPTRRVCLY